MALALAAVACAALFAPLARGAFGEEAARWGSIWFGIGTATLLFTARLPFAIGVAFGLAALLALQRRRYAVGDRVRDPVRRSAARWPGSSSRWPAWPWRSRRTATAPSGCEGLAIAAAAFIPPAFLSWAFPEGGWAPFPTSAYLPIPAFAIVCADRAAARAARAALGRGPVRARRDAWRCRSRRRWAATPCGSARCSAGR